MSDILPRLTAALAGRYHIERTLGQGGMATVYLADDVKHRRAELADSLTMIERSVDDIKAGRTQPAKTALRQVASELGLNLDR